MATATMAWEARKAAACGCIGRAEAPRRPPEWRRSRCCTVVHSIGAPDLVCSGIRGLRGYHPEPNLPGRSPPPLRPAAASGLQQLDPAAEQAAPLAICVLEEQKDLGSRWDLGVEERQYRPEMVWKYTNFCLSRRIRYQWPGWLDHFLPARFAKPPWKQNVSIVCKNTSMALFRSLCYLGRV